MPKSNLNAQQFVRSDFIFLHVHENEMYKETGTESDEQVFV